MHATETGPAAAGDVSFLAGMPGEPTLLLRHIRGAGPSVIYVHGATFPSGLSVGYRFEGLSWMDDLASRGFDVWAFDFAGFGGSERPVAFARAASAGLPFGRASVAADQLARVVGHVLATRGCRRVSLVAHSWGTIAAGLFATIRPDLVERLVLFGPIAQREGSHPAAVPGAWREVTLAQQRARFVEDVPEGHPPGLIEPELASWGPAYLASDPGAATGQAVPAVRIPGGPAADIQAARAGALAYRPELVRAPTLIVRGEWDSLCREADAHWLRQRLGTKETRDVAVREGTHLMHLERARLSLFVATGAFLMKTSF